MLSQLKEIIGVQYGLEWFRLSTRFHRENALLTQTKMFVQLHKFQLELFRHPLQVGYEFPQLFDLSATMNGRFWKETLLELSTSLEVAATKCMSPQSKMGGQHCSLAHR